MLRQRLLAAAAILGPVLLLFWLDDQWNFGLPGIWLLPLALVITGLIADELSVMCRQSSAAPRRIPAVAGSIVLVLAATLPYLRPHGAKLPPAGGTILGIELVLIMAFGWEMAQFRPGRQVLARLAATMLVVLYAGLSMGFVCLLRFGFPGREGLLAVLSVVGVAKLADTGAFFVGRSLGRHPMAPHLSPKKTFEGAAGALVTGAIAGWLALGVLRPWLLPQAAPVGLGVQFAFGIVLAAAGMFGDLAESLVKRDVACKDSSRWLPGLGGLLDVVDSILFAAPVGYLLWFYLLPHPT